MDKIKKINNLLSLGKDIQDFCIDTKESSIKFKLFNGIEYKDEYDLLEINNASIIFIDKYEKPVENNSLTPYGLFDAEIKKYTGIRLVELISKIYKFGLFNDNKNIDTKFYYDKYINDTKYFMELKGDIGGYILCEYVSFSYLYKGSNNSILLD